MHTINFKDLIKGFGVLAFFAIAGGCASTANIETAEQLAKATNGQQTPVVFGRLKLVRNGEPVQFGDGLLANSATLNLYQEGGSRQFTGRVGNDGEFSWALPAGTYHVESIAFRVQDQLVKPETNFTFTVSPEHDASYLGTITLEATFDSGYLGVHGGVDRFTVWDDCSTDCARRLSQLGISDQSSTSSLVRWQHGAQ